MKIALIHIGFFYSGGGERTVLNEAIGLQKRGHEVTVFCPTLKNSCFPELIEKVKFKQFCWWMPGGFPYRAASGMIHTAITPYLCVKYFKGFDIVIAHSQPSNWLAYNVKKSVGIPYIGYLHQANRFLYPRHIDKITGWSTDTNYEILHWIHKLSMIISRLDRLSILEAKTIFVNSQWVKAKVDKMYDLESELCYPGVNPDKFSQTGGSGNQVMTPYLLSTNRHYPQKCLHYVLKIMSLMQKDYPFLKCYLTGAFTSYTNQLVEYAEKLGISKNIVFTNNLNESDLMKLYRHAYVYAFTSPEEDLGLGPIEAGAFGVPSIVWDNAGPRETVIDGKTGYRVKPFDIYEMTQRHRKLIEDPNLRDEMGSHASKFVRHKFTWDKHIDILEKAMAN